MSATMGASGATYHPVASTLAPTVANQAAVPPTVIAVIFVVGMPTPTGTLFM